MTIRMNQRGASTIFVAAVIVLAVIVGAGIYVRRSNSDKSVYDKGVSKLAGNANTPAPSADKTAEDGSIVEAVRSYLSDKFGTKYADSKITVDTIEGDNALGLVSADTDSLTFNAHKDDGKWIAVYAGPDRAPKEIGEKYGFPKNWYNKN